MITVCNHNMIKKTSEEELLKNSTVYNCLGNSSYACMKRVNTTQSTIGGTRKLKRKRRRRRNNAYTTSFPNSTTSPPNSITSFQSSTTDDPNKKDYTGYNYGGYRYNGYYYGYNYYDGSSYYQASNQSGGEVVENMQAKQETDVLVYIAGLDEEARMKAGHLFNDLIKDCTWLKSSSCKVG